MRARLGLLASLSFFIGTSALAAAPTYSDAEICASPCLLLATTPLDEAAKGYCDRCGSTVASACSDAWLDPCGADDLRNCVYAANGQPFKQRKWQERFGKQGWYTPKKAADVKLSQVARENVRELLTWVCGEDKPSESKMVEAQADGSYRFALDLDGDGKDENVVIDAETITIGSSKKKLPSALEDGHWVEILDIDKSDERKEIGIVPAFVEDDATYTFVGYYDGKTTLLGDIYIGGAGTWTGDGNVSTSHGNCGVSETETWRLKGKRLVRVKHRKVGKYDIGECSACPFVFVATPDGLAYQGKIIRNLVGAEAAATQSLGLLVPNDDGLLEVRVAERESETTFIDDVYVTVDGIRVDAEEHFDLPIIMRYGEQLDLTFMLPPGSTEARVELWAHGYYVPDLQ